ncbi:MAG: MBL fold metallo-hydrolase [Bdellovibrionales bacterium]|nr:MBL fold metallo-hydrolase [Bdellovibrionales bacterium]
MPLVDWKHGSWILRGSSLAGVGTHYSLLGCDVAFDVAQGFPHLAPISRFFITHGHMDHAAGIPYIISQRALAHLPPAKFYMPASMVSFMTGIMAIWQEMEGHEYSFEFCPLSLGDEVPLRNDLIVKPFRTMHRIPSLGYTVFQIRKNLRPDLVKLTETEIREQRRRGVEVNVRHLAPEISFSGDTKIEFFDECEWVRKSRILVMEVTYIDENKSVQNARDWGHIHLDELLPRLPLFEGEKILLTHLSGRHGIEDCERILDKRVPKDLRDKIAVFPRFAGS